MAVNKGHQITLIAIRPDLRSFPLPNDIKKNLNIHILDGTLWNIISRFMLLRMKSKFYFQNIIYFDFKGFFFFPLMIAKASNHFFYSLELDDFHGLIGRLKWKYINLLMRYTTGLIIQGPKRLEAFKRLSYVGDYFFIPNAPLKKPCLEKFQTDYFKIKFNLPKGSQIILISGSMIKEHLVNEIMSSIQDLPNNIILIFHGWFPDRDIFAQFNKLKEKYPKNVFYSDNFFNYDDRLIPFSSSDYILVDYANTNLNLTTAPESSGKLYEAQASNLKVVTTSKNLDYVLSKKNILFFPSWENFFCNLDKLKMAETSSCHDECVFSEPAIEFFLETNNE